MFNLKNRDFIDRESERKCPNVFNLPAELLRAQMYYVKARSIVIFFLLCKNYCPLYYNVIFFLDFPFFPIFKNGSYHVLYNFWPKKKLSSFECMLKFL